MIQIEDLTFTYAGAARPAIQSLTFTVERGEIFGFLGPNGAGKSTTQKILIGLLKDYRGKALLMGKDLNQWKSDLYERIGVSFEFPNHYLKLTGLENLNYFRALYQRETCSPAALLEKVDLTEAANMAVSQYSKGMKNRLSLARSLLNNPELLFLDEPTSGLDPGNARRIKDLIKMQKAEGRTVFLTTHDMSAAEELCDRVVFLVQGSIRLIDKPAELKLRYGKAIVRVTYQSGNGTQHLDFDLQGLGHDPKFLQLLRDQKIETIHTLEASLDEIFIRVTGHRLT